MEFEITSQPPLSNRRPPRLGDQYSAGLVPRRDRKIGRASIDVKRTVLGPAVCKRSRSVEPPSPHVFASAVCSFKSRPHPGGLVHEAYRFFFRATNSHLGGHNG